METHCHSTIRSVHFSFITSSSAGFRHPKLSEIGKPPYWFPGVPVYHLNLFRRPNFLLGHLTWRKARWFVEAWDITFIQNKSHKSLNLCNYSAGGSKGLCRPLSGVRGSPTPVSPPFSLTPPEAAQENGDLNCYESRDIAFIQIRVIKLKFIN